jgi:hypothetical protein
MFAFMASPEMAGRRLLGAVPRGNFYVSQREANVAAIGGPRKGKGVWAITLAVFHRGLLVVFSVKRTEWSRGLGVFRFRMAGPRGRLMSLDVGGAPPPPGFEPVGVTPVSKTSKRANAQATGMIEAAEMEKGTKGGGFFAEAAKPVLAGFLLAAGIDDLPMEWVVQQVKLFEISEALDILRAAGDRGKQGVLNLEALERMPKETAGNVLTTVGTALRPYASSDEALAVTELPTVDFAAEHRGWPDEPNLYLALDGGEPPLGCFSTLLVTASSQEQALLAPVLQVLRTDLTESRFAQGNTGAETLFISDDTAALAKDPHLPKLLSQSAGQRLPIVSIHHSDAQLVGLWGHEGEAMPTYFSHEHVFRGISDMKTLDRLSKLSGERFIELSTTTEGRSGGSFGAVIAGTVSPTWQVSRSTGQHKVPRMAPDDIKVGHVDKRGYKHPDIVQSFGPDGWSWSYTLPAHTHPLMLNAAVASMRFIARHPAAESFNVPEPPELHRDGGQALLAAHNGDDGLFYAYFSSRNALAALAETSSEPAEDKDEDDDDDPSSSDDNDPNRVRT